MGTGENPDFNFSSAEKISLLKAARESIASSFQRQKPAPMSSSPKLDQYCGAFISLHKTSGELRGCIGYIEAHKPLLATVVELARSSAFQDPRFAPLKRDELRDIVIEISVLSPLRRIHDTSKIKIGEHGVLIKDGFHSGLLLPQVATEHHWDTETFLTHTCYKAGLAGNAWKKGRLEIDIFQALVFNEKDFKLL